MFFNAWNHPTLPGARVRKFEHPQKLADARNGEIVVALFEDEATVKRLSRKDGQVWLLPENPAYSPIDGRKAQIIGKVCAVYREYGR